MDVLELSSFMCLLAGLVSSKIILDDVF
jgi:hypothetical protein